MEDQRRAIQALNWIPEGSRKISRPRITWKTTLRKTSRIMESRGKRPSPGDQRTSMEELDCQRARQGMD